MAAGLAFLNESWPFLGTFLLQAEYLNGLNLDVNHHMSKLGWPSFFVLTIIIIDKIKGKPIANPYFRTQ
ncbi:hypothetical protein [Iodobacter fluviatilis]|uniref:Uncharacterized protein n=1 Tax=Iodobacter fluviatilis TaxID=537 RepID=A0A377Q3L7_9NEIS|nr:hypothetical protein [Iodobacter fluviatilis]TCU90370.1 hypothetical protein EV682_101403 [Iodobacter fluviatilis]STQ89397.1 Uncharacterised protein [Iodobacter fluviatilis]